MADNKKLFKPEDFDKPKEIGKNGTAKKWFLIIGVAVVVTTKNNPVVSTTGRTDVLKETAQAAQPNSAAEVAKAETGKQIDAGQAGNAADNKSQNVTSANADKAPVENVSVKADTKKQATSSANSNASDINVSATTPSSSVQETANEVLKGVYGNGVTRKHKLGSRYAEVQRHVNEMYRNGFVH